MPANICRGTPQLAGAEAQADHDELLDARANARVDFDCRLLAPLPRTLPPLLRPPQELLADLMRPSRERARFSSEFISALLRDSRQGGPAAIAKVRKYHPAAYMKNAPCWCRGR